MGAGTKGLLGFWVAVIGLAIIRFALWPKLFPNREFNSMGRQVLADAGLDVRPVERNRQESARWLDLGDYAFSQEQYREALRDYALAMRSDLDSGPAWAGIGKCYEFLREHHEAIGPLREAIRDEARDQDPDIHDSWLYLAGAYRGAGECENARRAWHRAAGYDRSLPSNPPPCRAGLKSAKP